VDNIVEEDSYVFDLIDYASCSQQEHADSKTAPTKSCSS